MKTTTPKGMRHITTIQGLRSRAVPSSREQIMAELSRLEHEKARLEREQRIWNENQRKTDERLQATEDRIDLLRGAFEQIADPRAGRRATGRTAPLTCDAGGPSTSSEQDHSTMEWHTVVLEY